VEHTICIVNRTLAVDDDQNLVAPFSSVDAAMHYAICIYIRWRYFQIKLRQIISCHGIFMLIAKLWDFVSKIPGFWNLSNSTIPGNPEFRSPGIAITSLLLFKNMQRTLINKQIKHQFVKCTKRGLNNTGVELGTECRVPAEMCG